MKEIEQTEPEIHAEFMCAGAKFSLGKDRIIRGQFHRMKPSLWDAIVGFHRQISINHSSESVSYHKWIESLQDYVTVIPYQIGRKHGLSVDVNWKDTRNESILNKFYKEYGEELFPACTVHTHVDVRAFESGTDAADEIANAGWHITLGDLISKAKYDTHFRMRMPAKKSIKEYVDIQNACEIAWDEILDPESGDEDYYFKRPGTTDFHSLLGRVEFTNPTAQKNGSDIQKAGK